MCQYVSVRVSTCQYMSVRVSMCQYMSVCVKVCQYVLVCVSNQSPNDSVIQWLIHPVTQSSSDSVIQWLSHPVTQSSRVSVFFLHSCLKIFDLCLIIQYQSLQTSAFWLKSSVMLANSNAVFINDQIKFYQKNGAKWYSPLHDALWFFREFV